MPSEVDAAFVAGADEIRHHQQATVLGAKPEAAETQPELPLSADFIEKLCRPKTAEIFCRSETGPRSNHSK
jgi:hypothetical protein